MKDNWLHGFQHYALLCCALIILDSPAMSCLRPALCCRTLPWLIGLALLCFALPGLPLPCLALPCLVLPCLALPCHALQCLVFPLLALPCLASPRLNFPSLALLYAWPCIVVPWSALQCLALNYKFLEFYQFQVHIFSFNFIQKLNITHKLIRH